MSDNHTGVTRGLGALGRQAAFRTAASAIALSLGAACGAARADTAPPPASRVEELVVTAQKREEKLQNVPVSVQALGGVTLKRANVADFQDSLALLPSVSSALTSPGNGQIYMRGISDGSDGNPSGASPSVAIYLDDQPVTSIGRVLDVHAYDIARVEALPGPQGTLYGANSEAGTLKIVTNAPSTTGFKGGVDVRSGFTEHGTPSWSVEGFVNLPISNRMALRVVAWDLSDGGYVDNKHVVTPFIDPSFQGPGFAPYGVNVDNAAVAKSAYNTIDNVGARAALKIDLDDNWSATARVVHQRQTTNGVFGYNPAVGDLEVERYTPDHNTDEFTQGSLTLNGKVGSTQLTYAGSYLDRSVHYQTDYSVYSELSAYIPYYVCQFDANGAIQQNGCSDPRINFTDDSHYSVLTQEGRVQTDPSKRLRLIAGGFYERAEHSYVEQWLIPGLPSENNADHNPLGNLTGHDPTAYFVTDQKRTDQEEAGFGELSFDIIPKLTATGGIRVYHTDSALSGTVGTAFSLGGLLNLHTGETGELYKGSLSFKPSKDVLVYFTYSQGFRPSGNNRVFSVIPVTYQSDHLYNYEFGWKSTWFDQRLRINGAAFIMDWKNVQLTRFDPSVSLLGLTANVGAAIVKGLEMDFSATPAQGLTLSGAFSALDPHLSQDYVRQAGGTVDAPAGTRLPYVATFQGNLTGRYQIPIAGGMAYGQASAVYTGSRYNDLFVETRSLLPAYTVVNLSVGFDRGPWTTSIYLENVGDERAHIATDPVLKDGIIDTNRPRTVWLKVGRTF